ncbi:hypothetical protein HO173_011212 [Letharia columbiana]|uniref:Uncharacterized protein n=1 Tax=Letharia columbiana TaxID=112416 RepID=A0A8H6FJS1_9LECA|nr:uncharacterized protein HO173_011212 [Letharia columbiana]KAF6229782.1 hypothetical protein HO173_011212 [Letharia columbiana]
MDTKMATDSPPMTTSELEELQGAKPPDNKEELEKFVRWRIQQYKIHKFTTLSDVFADDFALYVREDFEVLSKDAITSLRDCLRANGAYVKERKRTLDGQRISRRNQGRDPMAIRRRRPSPTKTISLLPSATVSINAGTTALSTGEHYSSPPQTPYQPIVEDTTPVHLPPTPIVEDTTPVHPPSTPSDGPPHYRVPHLLPSPYQVIQDFEIKEQAVAEDSLKSTTMKSITSSSPVNTSQLSAVLRPRTISILRESTFSLSTARIQHTPNLAPPFASQHAHFLAPLFASQHSHFLASWLASPLGYIRDTEKRKAIGQG